MSISSSSGKGCLRNWERSPSSRSSRRNWLGSCSSIVAVVVAGGGGGGVPAVGAALAAVFGEAVPGRGGALVGRLVVVIVKVVVS